MATPDRGLRDKALNIINNVGQYGPLDATIDSYKQAADYADDARQYAELALSGVEDLQTQITRVTELADQVDELNDKVEESYTQVTTLDVDATDGSTASAVYDKTENKIHFTLPSGRDGVDGEDGKSAYQSYLDTTTDNPKLSEADWILSLHGKDGVDGQDGKDGTNGTNGTNGYSAYELAVIGGYDGTLDDFNNLNTKSLDKGQNLSDLTNVVAARTNLDVYSTSQVDSAISTSSSDLQALISAKANKGVNSDITALSGLTVALSIGQGGTGAKTAADARTNISAAKSGANSDITDLTGLVGPLDVKKDGSSSTQAVTYRQFTRSSTLEQLLYKMAGGEVVKFAAYGDSTTDGNYTTSWTANPVDANGNAVGQIDHNTTAPNAWPAVLQSLLREMYVNNNIRVFNAGYGGKKLIDDWAINNYDAAITNNPQYGKPDATFIDFGLNDFNVVYNSSPDYATYISKHRLLIEKIISLGTLPILLTSGPTSRTRKGGVGSMDNFEIMNICNMEKQKLAKEYNIPIIDKASILRDWIAKSEIFQHYAVETDWLHFQDVGHSMQAQYIATELYRNIVKASPGCREHINSGDSRSGYYRGPNLKWATYTNTRFGGNVYVESTDYTANQVLMNMYVWCTGKDVSLIYRAVSGDGGTNANASKISIYQYANKTELYGYRPPRGGYTASAVSPSDQPFALAKLDYGLYRIQYIAPATPVRIDLGHFEVIDGWGPGKAPSWRNTALRSWRQQNLLKNSGELIQYGGQTSNGFYSVQEDPDGGNCIQLINDGSTGSRLHLIMSMALGSGCGVNLCSSKGWLNSDGSAIYDSSLLLQRGGDGSVNLFHVYKKADLTIVANKLASSSTGLVTTDNVLDYRVTFITNPTGIVISVATSSGISSFTEVVQYSVVNDGDMPFPAAGVFGGIYINANSTGVRVQRATALYLN